MKIIIHLIQTMKHMTIWQSLVIKKGLDKRLERKRLKHELEDYEGELDGEFDWDR